MTAPVTQMETLRSMPLAAGERARFFVPARFPGLDCLTATFRTHVYAAHTHETYVVGTVDAGCETWNARGTRHYAAPGDVLFNLPLDVHDGAPFGAGYSYRMSYPTVAFMQRVASAVCGRSVTATPTFKAAVVRDPDGAQLFSGAHAALERGSIRWRAKSCCSAPMVGCWCAMPTSDRRGWAARRGRWRACATRSSSGTRSH
jgi:hypothetical protein